MKTEDTHNPDRKPFSEPPPSPLSAGPSPTRLAVYGVAVGMVFVLGVLAANPIRSIMSLLTPSHDHGTAKKDSEEVQWYISGMHPWIIRPEPGYCPICGMELTPLSPDMLQGELAIDPRIVQNIGVRIAKVERRPFESVLHTVGSVEIDERSRFSKVLRTPGYLEKLYVQYAGQQVKQGDVIAEIHSPEILAALGELRTLRSMRPEAPETKALRQRLRIMGLHEDQIHQLETVEELPWTFALTSPANGVVTSLKALQGQWLDRGSVLVELADLSRVWMQATVFESHLGRVREGLPAKAYIPNLPGKEWKGTTSYLYPTLNPQSRQGLIRLEFDNIGNILKPGMFARIAIEQKDTTPSLMVPREAVLDTGMRQLVFTSLGDGRFEPIEVRVGRESEHGWIEVLEGLRENDSVVVSGQFLLDSESRLRESILKLVLGEDAASQRVQAPVAIYPSRSALQGEAVAALSETIDHYLSAIRPLVQDHTRDLHTIANQLQAAAHNLVQMIVETEGGDSELHPKAADLEAGAKRLAEAQDTHSARLALRSLSNNLRTILHKTGLPAEYPLELHEVRCPMFPDFGDEAWWIQPATPTENPYMGQGMLTCHDQRFALARSGSKEPENSIDADSETHESPTLDKALKARGEITRFPELRLSRDGNHPLIEALHAYLDMGYSLAGDSLDSVAENSDAFRAALMAMEKEMTFSIPHSAHTGETLKRAHMALTEMANATTLEQARMPFAVLGEEFIGLVETVGLPRHYEGDLIVARCHMFPTTGQYGWWMQTEGPLKNPLWGSAMLRCADLRRPIHTPDVEQGQKEHDHD